MSVKKARRLLPRCSGVTSDGTQCGRRVADGSNPPLCHIHAAIARGQSHSPLMDSGDEIDEVKILKRLARSKDDRVKLRAVDLLLEVKRRRLEAPAPAGPNYYPFVKALTTEERALVSELTMRFRALKEAVYERCPELAPASWRPADDLCADTATREDEAPPSPAAPMPEEDPDEVVIES
jgi:hypothetical protein